MMDVLYIIAGLVLLFFGGEGLVRGSVNIAGRMGISTLLVSLVIVGFGTSAPELLVSVQAALVGSSDIALGNVVGSNIANVLFILGVAAVICPLSCENKTIRRDMFAVIGASILLAGLSFLDVINLYVGVAMIVLLIGYLSYAYYAEKEASVVEIVQKAEQQEHITQDMGAPDDGMVKSALFVLGGLALLVVGANFLVTGATSLARGFGISEAVIGLSLVALGTSLPELATAVVAAMRRHSDVIIGNVLGSNLFNILSILGITAVISPLSMQGRIADLDIWLMLASALMLYPVMRSGRIINRMEGALFIALYMAYMGFLFIM